LSEEVRRIDAAQADVDESVRPVQLPSLREHRCAGLGIDEMADELKRYWFIAAVFRETRDLVSTVAELRGNGFAGERLLIVANDRAEDARKAVDGTGVDAVPVAAVYADGAIASSKLPVELRTLLEAMGNGDAPEERCGGDGEGKSQVYAQLRQDVADGALILIASVAGPDEQLIGARILLRGTCECVLTHEIAA
jgi:hypothetical protein